MQLWALGVAHADLEAVPGAARVTVSPAEREWQILVGLAHEVSIASRFGERREPLARDQRGQIGDHPALAPVITHTA
ncbi:MAG TPA: hypothetical protein VIK01_24655 [Polyangiaceae bacterium]